MKKNLVRLWKKITALIKAISDKVYQLILAWPIATLLIILLTLAGLIVVGHTWRNQTNPGLQQQPPVKTVEVYQIGQAPRVKVLATVHKDNVIQVRAQTAGIVHKLYVTEGEQVNSGQRLAYISSNPQGGSSAILQAQVAQKQYQHAVDTYQTQSEVISKQREIAQQTEINSDELREINQQNLTDTQDLLDFNQDLLDDLQDNLDTLEANNQTGSNDDLIISTKSSMSQLMNANNQLKSSIRQLEHQTDSDHPPAKLADLQKELTLKQLDISAQSLALQKEVSKLQYQISQISQSLAFPTSYMAGTIEAVHVKAGQSVSPGSLLFTVANHEQEAKPDIKSTKNSKGGQAAGPSEADNQSHKQTASTTTVVAHVKAAVANNISYLEPSILYLEQDLNQNSSQGQSRVEIKPSYISQEATQGLLYSVIYPIPDQYQAQLTNQESVPVEIPIGYADTNAVMPYIPLDSVYQNAEQDYVFVKQDGQVVVRPVKLGVVYGDQVQVKQGIHSQDQIILNRNVVEGDRVQLAD
jgi:multidrug efflux pump subunit AcrA (membrane-fusion protein)